MKQRKGITFLSSFILMMMFAVSSLAQEKINREILPIVAPEPETYTELDVRNTKPPVPYLMLKLQRVLPMWSLY